MKEVHRIDFMVSNPRRLHRYEELHDLFRKRLDEEFLGAIPYQTVSLGAVRGEPRLVRGHLFQVPLNMKTYEIVRRMRLDFQVRPATLAEVVELAAQGACPLEIFVTALGTIYLTESGACVPTVSARKDGLELVLDQVEGVPWSHEYHFLGMSLGEAETPEPKDIH